MIDIDRADLDIMSSRVGHELCRPVEPHRLAVQQGRQEDRGMMALDPGRNVHQQGERRGMGLGESVGPETFELPEELTGELLGVSVGEHALDQLLLELFDEPCLSARRPWLAATGRPRRA